MNRDRPLALITNDDGVGCRFLHELVAAVSTGFRVAVVAPLGEQSWIGRAFSRHRELRATRAEVPGAELAWAVDGTPSDCVNIAFAHLLREARPDIVLSGINIGFNASAPLILSSGTVAGAIEGAAHGVPAAAFSLDLAPGEFDKARRANGEVGGATRDALLCAAARAAGFAAELARLPRAKGVTVHNFNFPDTCTTDTPVEDAEPATILHGSLFRETAPGVFHFRWEAGVDISPERATDVAALRRGVISRSVIDFSALGRFT